MSALRTLGWIAFCTARVTRWTTTTGVRVSRFAARHVGVARRRGGAGEAGMMRLLDLHAASCAGDTLMAIGLAGMVFFSVPVSQTRGRAGLYLLVMMLPFVVLAPVLGPMLDRFRYGRRYALAVTMLGRGVLAYLVAGHIGGPAPYLATFGTLVLSRAYGVVRGAVVPRVVPEGLALSQVDARASVSGTAAGAVAAALGLAASAFDPRWTLRLAMIGFGLGVVFALRLPPRAGSQPPETVPRILAPPGRRGSKVLSGPVVATLISSAILRALYGFLALHLAFSVRAGDLPTRLGNWTLPVPAAVGLLAGALGLGSFLAAAVGSGLRINRPAALQAGAAGVVTLALAGATWHYTLAMAALLGLVTAIGSGLATLAVHAVISERVPEPVRASAFAHAGTLLILAWVGGGALGLVPFEGRTALLLAAGYLAFGTARAAVVAVRPHGDGPHPVAEGRSTPAGRSAMTVQQRSEAEPVGTTGRGRRRKRQTETGVRVDQPVPSRQFGATRAGPDGAPDADEPPLAPPGYHLYRPGPTQRLDDA